MPYNLVFLLVSYFVWFVRTNCVTNVCTYRSHRPFSFQQHEQHQRQTSKRVNIVSHSNKNIAAGWKTKMADASTTNTEQHIHKEEPLLTFPNQKCWKQNWTATFQPPGCLWFLSWMKELPHSFPAGSEVSLCAACLPACHGSRMLSDCC